MTSMNPTSSSGASGSDGAERQPCARIDLNQADGRARLAVLRSTLASQGELVSPAGRQRTIDVFGEPLTPRQVVERICGDVQRQGLSALLDYTRRIDGAEVTRESLFVEASALAAAHAAVAPDFLRAVRRIEADVARFQQALLSRDVEVPLAGGACCGSGICRSIAWACASRAAPPPIPRHCS